jgi:hypothetical protein
MIELLMVRCPAMSSIIEPLRPARWTAGAHPAAGLTLVVACAATLLVLVEFTTVLTTARDTAGTF